MAKGREKSGQMFDTHINKNIKNRAKYTKHTRGTFGADECRTISVEQYLAETGAEKTEPLTSKQLNRYRHGEAHRKRAIEAAQKRGEKKNKKRLKHGKPKKKKRVKGQLEIQADAWKAERQSPEHKQFSRHLKKDIWL